MVYRPPKKKPDGSDSAARRVSVDPLGGPLRRAADGEEILDGDDRHLVAVDESYAGGDLEDRMWLFWRKQRANIVRLLVAIAVAIVVWQSWNLYQEHAAANMQADFSAASGAPALLAFAQAHPQADLGKIAQLEGADALYKDSKFKEAADAYAQAATLLGTDDKAQRARLGHAIALIQSGDAKTGGELLEALTNDASALENYRAESAYYLAVLAAQSGDPAGAAKWTDRVKEFKTNNPWISPASTLDEVVPLLSDIKIETGYNPPKPPPTPVGLPLTATPTATPVPAAAISAPPASAPAATSSAKPAPAKSTSLLPTPDFPAL